MHYIFIILVTKNALWLDGADSFAVKQKLYIVLFCLKKESAIIVSLYVVVVIFLLY